MENIFYQISGEGSTALLFVHGWQGNNSWWNAQRDFFSNQYTIVQMDLPGHGKSRPLPAYTHTKYAEAIKNVADKLDAKNIILVGHSMSGAYVLEASLMIPRTKAIVVVDTLKNLDELFSYEQADKYMFSQYRKDFKATIENVLPQYLFAEGTPPEIKKQLQEEFLATDVEHAIAVIEPLYRIDIQSFAKKQTVPVRAINSDFSPTNVTINRKYFRDYDCVEMARTGHYPMLENPQEFNRLLAQLLAEFN